MSNKLILLLIIGIVFVSGCVVSPMFGNYKCNKYCGESYEGKSESGFFNGWYHSYKCENSTLWENHLNGRCEDEDGYATDCVTYSCSER